MNLNIDQKTVDDFGDEWDSFDQKNNFNELNHIFNNYFKIFPFKHLTKNSVGFDAGCGSGRWANFISPLVKNLYCIEPSHKAIKIAKENLSDKKNCIFFKKSINEFFENSKLFFDFGYCLGVLHHIPNTNKALNTMTSRLKKNAPFLLYLYYNFDNRSKAFIFIWKISNFLRIIISKFPFRIKKTITDMIALFIYYPLARLNLFLDYLNIRLLNLPLKFYKNKSLYVMRNDSLDRFGTRLEKRFTKKQIYKLMDEASLANISFHVKEPYWVAIGYKK